MPQLRFISSLFKSILVSGFFFSTVGCAPTATPSVVSDKSGTLVIGGSGAAYPVLRSVSAAFTQRYPRVTVAFESSSQTATAVKYVADGNLDIGALARPLNEKERDPELKEIYFARDAVVLAVHHNVPVTAVTSAQVQAVYGGTIRSWKTLGGKDRDIVLLDRPEGETAKIALRQFVLGSDFPVVSDAVLLSSESDMYEALANVSDTIGYLSLSYTLQNPTRMHALALDGVMPSVETLRSGGYRVKRPIGMVIKVGRINDWPLREFIGFVSSADARAALLQVGYVLEEKP